MEATSNDKGFHNEVNEYVNVVIENLPVTKRRIQQIRKHKEEDAILREVLLPDMMNIHHEIKPYYSVLSELSGLLLRGSWIVISQSLQADILTQVHRGH